MPNYSDEELLAEIERLAEGDKPPTQAEMNEDGMVSAQTYHRRFGSWNNALESAGYGPNRPSRYSDQELLDEIDRLANDDTPPTTTE
ncbi:MAG: homing endonuclease associated repeat-containing protein, partial [Halobacteriaceae archaeon]